MSILTSAQNCFTNPQKIPNKPRNNSIKEIERKDPTSKNRETKNPNTRVVGSQDKPSMRGVGVGIEVKYQWQQWDYVDPV